MQSGNTSSYYKNDFQYKYKFSSVQLPNRPNLWPLEDLVIRGELTNHPVLTNFRNFVMQNHLSCSWWGHYWCQQRSSIDCSRSRRLVRTSRAECERLACVSSERLSDAEVCAALCIVHKLIPGLPRQDGWYPIALLHQAKLPLIFISSAKSLTSSTS